MIGDAIEDEICNTDAIPPHGDYYVTVRDGARTGFLLGPYSDARDANKSVSLARSLAIKADPFAHFYAFGVSRLPIGTPCKTVFA
jgi:hypothetical protein